MSIAEVSRGNTVSIRNHYFDGTAIDRVYRTPILEPQVAAAVD